MRRRGMWIAIIVAVVTAASVATAPHERARVALEISAEGVALRTGAVTLKIGL